MPKLWSETIETHRLAVREAALDAVAELVAAHGPGALTMSQIAQRAGIGRATLYKYFPDVDAALQAWHGRQIEQHLAHLTAVGHRPGTPLERLEAVLGAYALMVHQRPHTEPAAALHRGRHIGKAHAHLDSFVAALLSQAAGSGQVRGDVPPAELAAYTLHALSAAAVLPSADAVRRLVGVTLAGLAGQG